jgi:amino acid transporter
MPKKITIFVFLLVFLSLFLLYFPLILLIAFDSDFTKNILFLSHGKILPLLASNLSIILLFYIFVYFALAKGSKIKKIIVTILLLVFYSRFSYIMTLFSSDFSRDTEIFVWHQIVPFIVDNFLIFLATYLCIYFVFNRESSVKKLKDFYSAFRNNTF